MKFLLFFLLVSSAVKSQSTHFIYIQTEDKQAFYAKTTDHIYSSSDVGYLVIPKLTEGNFAFTIGFPKNLWPSINYNVEINQKDLGFQLKKVDAVTWALYNFQTSELVSALENNQIQPAYAQINNDEFSNVLAQVSNTPSINQQRINNYIPLIAKKDTAILISKSNEVSINNEIVIIKDTIVAKKQEPVVIEVDQIDSTVKNEIAVMPSLTLVIKQKTFLDSTGWSANFIIYEDDKTDTVLLFISNNDTGNNKELPIVATAQENPQPTEVAIIVTEKEDPKIQEKLVANENPVKADSLSPVIAVISTNKPCDFLAEEKDFIQLRRLMTSEDTEDKMIDIARNGFLTRCYTTEQIKNLAVLFLKDDSRLLFLQAAYPYSSDSYNFNGLQNLLTEERNIISFKSMLH